jgi:hypothetical protein
MPETLYAAATSLPQLREISGAPKKGGPRLVSSALIMGAAQYPRGNLKDGLHPSDETKDKPPGVPTQGLRPLFVIGGPKCSSFRSKKSASA